MNWDGQRKRDDADELGRDAELASLLELVDPAARDPHYWLRFQNKVLKSASGELARRRLMADLTVGEVLSSWARAVVPTAILAAVVAAMVLLHGQPVTAPMPTSVEDLLVAGLGDQTIPAALSSDEDGTSQVAFAGDRF
ncbi:MAG: hypothetical protein PVJ02_09895 [Gemmatimonadota bacterium]|jgi:hypothetical protein